MKIIPNNEQFTGKLTKAHCEDFDIGNVAAQTRFTWVPKVWKNSNKKAICEVSFDFENVSLAEIVELATETLIIRWRAARNGLETIPEDIDGSDESVRKMLAAGRQRVDKVQKTISTVEKMSDADKLALLEMLKKQLEANEE